MAVPFSPPIQFLTKQYNARPFSSPAVGPAPPGGEDPGIFAGFIGSMFSGLPELFGAPPTQLAEQYRTEHPIGGFISGNAGALIPYLGAERVAQLPSIAPRLAAGVESLLGKVGMNTVDNPVYAGIARELIVNAPVEASRLAVGTALYPDNHDLWGDVALNYALTGGIGGIAGKLRAGGKVLSKAGQVKGAEITLAPTEQLKLILDDGAQVANVPKEEFIPQLRQQILTETPGKGGASGKEMPYILPLEGMSADENAALNSLFQPGRTKAEVPEGQEAPLTGLVKQRLDEGRSPNQLKEGEQQTLLSMLPETFQTIDDVAKNVQFPRRLTVADQAGARQLAGVASKPGWMQVSDRLALVQERDGGFLFKYKLADGKGRAIGKGAGKVKEGEQYLIGKTVNPGLFDPQAEQLADLVTGQWARMGKAFHPGAYTDLFNKDADLAIKAMSVIDYNNLGKQPESVWKTAMKSKVGQALSGALDSKLGYKDSKGISDFVDNLYASFKPTEFLQRQNPVYGRFFALIRNGQRVADRLVTELVRGKTELKAGTTGSQVVLGKGTLHPSPVPGLKTVAEAVFSNIKTNQEATLIKNLSGTGHLGEQELEHLVNSGELTSAAADGVRQLNAINNYFTNDIIMPVFKQTGYDVAWLENHLGIPHSPEGSLFYTVTNEAGQPKYLAYGKNGAAALHKAKTVQAVAEEAGKKWKVDEGKPRHVAAEPEDVLTDLSKQIFTNVQRTPEDGEIIFRAMRRLTAIKAGTGKNPTIPSSTRMLRPRGKVQTSFEHETYTPADLVSAIEGHMKQLARFAAAQSWKERFGSVAASMLENDKVLYQDLIRKSNQMLGIEGQITNTLNKILEPVLGPKAATKIASGVNHYIAAANIFWFNPTFGVVNLLTPVQTVAAWVAHMRVATAEDLAKTTFMQLSPALDPSGMPVGVAAFLDPLKVLWGSTQMLRRPTPELAEHYARADVDGVFHTHSFEEWSGKQARAQQTLREAFHADGIVGFLKHMAEWSATRSEQFSRLIAFNAGHIVGKTYFNLEGDALYRFSRRAVEMTQYNYSTIDRSRIFTGPVGSMFGLFKNWQMHFLGNMLGYAGLIKNDAANPGAWAPMVWTVGSALAIGGLGATPLVAMADGLANWEGKDPNSYLWVKNHFGPQASDALYFGLPAFLGVSLQASAAIPGTDVRNETASLFSFAAWQRVKMLGEAGYNIWQNEQTIGRSGIEQQQVKDKLFSSIMPRFFTKLFSVVEGDYVRSASTGAPQVRNPSLVAKMLQGAGFNPIEIANWQEASRRAYSSDQERQYLVEGLGRGYAAATLNGDREEANRILQRSIIAGELPSVMKSAARHTARENSQDILSRYSKEQQAPYRQVLEPQPEE